ncbi:MAG: DUF3488 and DUF4129 domain-containing transglutaminase family protein [Candidatus Methylomirabilales bacterium]
MRLTRAYHGVIYLLVTDGLLGLLVSGRLALPYWFLVGGGVALSWRWNGRREATALTRRLRQGLPWLLSLIAALDVLWAETLLLWAVRLLIYLILFKLATRETARDDLQLALMSFMALVAASALTAHILFLPVLVAYILLAVWAGILLHLRLESERVVQNHAPTELVPRAYLVVTALVACAALVMTGTLFLILPRIGRGSVSFLASGPHLLAGFSERVALGQFGRINLDPTPVMRVEIAEASLPPPRLRWRGVAFEEFDGTAWHRSREVWVLDPREGQLFLTELMMPPRVIRQEIFLEPLGSPVLFAAPRVRGVVLGAPMLLLDGTASLTLPGSPTSQVHYLAYSEPEAFLGTLPPSGQAPPGQAPKTGVGKYLQLPPLSPRFHALAREIVGDATEAWEKARRIDVYLSTRFTYSLDIDPVTQSNPVEDFLFVNKRGHCEYFATAMAVLLRAVEVPARVVNGFQQGEWNEFGRYFTVRQRDAHSWVEAYMPGQGWRTFDPSPRGAFDATHFGTGPGTGRRFFDYLGVRWNRYVVGFTMVDQFRLFHRAGAPIRGMRARVTAALDWARAQGPPALWIGGSIGVSLVVGLGLYFLQRRARRLRLGGGRGLGIRVGFYDELERLLERWGYVRPPATTPEELANGLAGGPDASLAPVVLTLTRLYYRVRYGAAPLTPPEEAQARRWLDGLRARAPARPVEGMRGRFRRPNSVRGGDSG